MAQVKIEMAESEIRAALAAYVERHYGASVDPRELHVEVKSKQNYRSEWEKADIRVAATCTMKGQ